MRIVDLISTHAPFLSLEFFPPRERAEWPGFFRAVERLRAVNPLFVSVTYGAGGGTQAHTLEIVTRLKREFHLEPMAHLTCVGASEEKIRGFIGELGAAGIDNVLALRGDLPQGEENSTGLTSDFRYAGDLVAFIRARYPGMGIGVAGYPEGHPEAPCLEEDLRFVKEKLDRGGDFVITQLFFDNDHYRDFVRRARELGITKPIIPGIMPIFNLNVIKRITSLCGASVPSRFLEELEEAQREGGNEAVQALGIAHARSQVQELLDHGVPGVHLYTLNKAEACLDLVQGLTVRR